MVLLPAASTDPSPVHLTQTVPSLEHPDSVPWSSGSPKVPTIPPNPSATLRSVDSVDFTQVSVSTSTSTSPPSSREHPRTSPQDLPTTPPTLLTT